MTFLSLLLPVALWAQSITPTEIHDLARDAKLELRLYAKYGQSHYDPATASPAERKLFGGSTTLWDRLEVPLITSKRQPCRDAAGRAVEGALNTDGSPCLSTGLLSERLSQEDAYPEIGALLLRLLALSQGLTEEEAQPLQENFRLALAASGQDTLYFSIYQFRDLAYDISRALEESPDWELALNSAAKIAQAKEGTPFAFFFPAEAEYFASQLNLLEKREPGSAATLARYFRNLAVYFHTLAFNGSDGRAPIADEENPWTAFRGHYSILSKECTGAGERSFAGVTSITIAPDEFGWNLGRESVREPLKDSLEDWTFAPTDGVVRVKTEGGRALRTEEINSSWDRLWQRKSLALKAVDEGFELRESLAARFSDNYADLYAYDCIFRLRKE